MLAIIYYKLNICDHFLIFSVLLLYCRIVFMSADLVQEQKTKRILSLENLMPAASQLKWPIAIRDQIWNNFMKSVLYYESVCLKKRGKHNYSNFRLGSIVCACVHEVFVCEKCIFEQKKSCYWQIHIKFFRKLIRFESYGKQFWF